MATSLYVSYQLPEPGTDERALCTSSRHVHIAPRITETDEPRSSIVLVFIGIEPKSRGLCQSARLPIYQ